ncbi:hypothetical protein GUJ93_ZPchr0007g3568 [Zizania palustris]|uniref:Uncharacterized protein n=1 Tax=Zizania palustris TaxID=103762 RepID=A0A8J5TIY0_ZIZPA|nr:hypothetical protein GUJ93_ZPchr0007g3568 [Zizania palustris]
MNGFLTILTDSANHPWALLGRSGPLTYTTWTPGTAKIIPQQRERPEREPEPVSRPAKPLGPAPSLLPVASAAITAADAACGCADEKPRYRDGDSVVGLRPESRRTLTKIQGERERGHGFLGDGAIPAGRSS